MIHKRIDCRRAQRERVINRRIFIMSKIWNVDFKTFSGNYSQPGRYNKYNLTCQCWACGMYHKTKIAGYKRAELRKLEREKDNDE